MISLVFGKPGAGMTLDVGNPHELAARSLCIVLGSNPVLKSWPFMSARSTSGGCAASLRDAGALTREAHPVGNTGITSEASK